MAEPNESGIFREIDEEIRQEHYAKFWKKYGNMVIGAAALVVLGVAGFQGWKSYDMGRKTESGTELAAAMRLVDDGKTDAARAALDVLAETGRAGHAAIAQFQNAALLAETGRADDAAKIYSSLSNDGGLDQVYRDLALVLEATLRIDSMDGTLENRLLTLSGEGNPWRHSARELLALKAMQAGDREKALGLFEALSQDHPHLQACVSAPAT